MNEYSLRNDGLSFFERKIKDVMNVDVSSLDFTTLDDGVYMIDDYGHSTLLTNNKMYMDWFKAYENLKYGEVM